MVTWDDSQTLCQTFSGDSSSNSLTAFKMLMNIGYKEILHTFNGEETEDVRTTYTTAGSRGIKLPPNFILMHTATAKVGNQEYPIIPEESQENWNRRLFRNQSSTRPMYYFIRPRFGVGGSELLLDPIPSDNNTQITVNYSANARDLGVAKYATGTISIDSGGSTVTGVGTAFTAPMIGRYIKVDDETGDGNWYRITNQVDATTLTIENKYDGPAVSGVKFIISEIFGLPEDLQMGPVQYAMWKYYLGIRKDVKQASAWETDYLLTKTNAEKNYQKKNKNATVGGKRGGSSFPVATPNFWPESVG